MGLSNNLLLCDKLTAKFKCYIHNTLCYKCTTIKLIDYGQTNHRYVTSCTIIDILHILTESVLRNRIILFIFVSRLSMIKFYLPLFFHISVILYEYTQHHGKISIGNNIILYNSHKHML